MSNDSLLAIQFNISNETSSWLGYMIHEAVVWSNIHKKWFFLPRKASKSKYNDIDDERHGTNLLLVAGNFLINLPWKVPQNFSTSFLNRIS